MVHYTTPADGDDAEYLDWVETAIVGVEEAVKSNETYVVKIDNWFGQRWLGFSGKLLGKAGVRKKKLTCRLSFRHESYRSAGSLRLIQAVVSGFTFGNTAGRICSGIQTSSLRARMRFGTAVRQHRMLARVSWPTSRRRTGTGPGMWAYGATRTGAL